MYQPQQAPQTQKLAQVPDGVGGIAATLSYMQAFVKEGKIDPTVRGKAIELIQDLPPKEYKLEMEAIFDYVQNAVRYVRDISDVETVQSPVVTLDLLAGDCDDKATLLAAMLESIGFKTRFKAVGFTYNTIGHVYVENRLGTIWIPLDATEPYPAGWAPPASAVKASITRHN